MTSKVLHGEGKPRIVIPGSELFAGNILSISNVFNIELSGSFVFDSSVLNKMAYTFNANDEVTKGKVISYTNALPLFTVDQWDNLMPALNKPVSIHDTVMDLPYCLEEGLAERFKIETTKVKKLWNSGRKVFRIKGFYYSAILDYSKYSGLSFIQTLQPLFDASRTSSFLFYPRRDNPGVYYDCELDPESELALAQLMFHQGMKYLQIKIIGLDRITKPDLISNLSTVLGVDNIVMSDTFITE